MDARTKGRIQLLALALVFLGPLALAFWLYYGSSWRPSEQAVHGELISPPVPLPEQPLAGDGTARLRELWSLILVMPASCGPDCRNALYETRQLRTALGRDRDRVQRIWIVENGTPDFEFLRAEHPDLLIVDSGAGVGADLLDRLDRQGTVDIFVADPLGNLMMRFPPQLSMRDMHTDLKRLLKLSSIG